jgi:hypothetical protein
VSEWVIGTDELAQSRFQTSAMIETASALATLAGRRAAAGLKQWADTHRPAYQARIADDPFAAAFVQAALRPRWTAGIVVIPPVCSDRSFRDELRHVRQMPLKDARRDLSIDGRLPRTLHTRDLPRRAAELLEWVWTQTLRSDWPRRQRIFEADIVSRTQRLAGGGWAAAMDDMRHGMRWLGDGRLRVSAYDYPPRTITDAELMFIPSTSPPARVTWAEPHRYAVIYPCAAFSPTSPDHRHRAHSPS